MRAVDILERKRDGAELSDVEIRFLVDGYVTGAIPDHQMSAFAMAVCWRGMTDAETEALTRSMIASGRTVDLSSIRRPTVDKHSTGGVGDKTTLVVAPLVASLGAAVPKLSGRGLGHTGGTIDKLESIPGYRAELSVAELVAVTDRVGMAVASPTLEVVPADRRLYALRDATATVPSLPLVVSSIMSKKLAVATGALVLDVKVGAGAFFADVPAGRAFAEAAIRLGRRFDRPVRCVLTTMDRPLGHAIGNSLEVAEAVATLRGGGPADLVEVCVAVAAQMLIAAGVAAADVTARAQARSRLSTGAALETLRAWIEAQGGHTGFLAAGFPVASRRLQVRADSDGYVAAMRPRELGGLAMRLGAGRERIEDSIDHAAGIVLAVGVGDRVRAGDLLLTLHTNREGPDREWLASAAAAVEVGSSPPESEPAVIEVVAG